MPTLTIPKKGIQELDSGNVFQPRTTASGRTLLDTGLLVPIVVVLTFVALINFLQAYLIYFHGEKSLANFTRYLTSNLFYSWYFLVTAFVVKWLSGRVSLKRESLLPWGAIHLSAMALLTVAHQVMSLELDKRVLAFQRSETVFAVLLNNPAVWGDIVAYILFLLGFYMIEYRRTNRGYELEYSRLETELARTRLHELRGRVHPDFLLDTLDALRALLRSKQNKKANAALSQLSEFLRTTVYDHDRDEATLREEVVLMNRYIELEKLRMAGVISATEEIIGDAGNAVVASFLLQPIVEELIRSNLGGRAARCDIELRAETRDEMLEVVIKVRKDEVSREARMLSGGGALAMTKERLAHLYGEHQEFSIGLATGGREFVSLKIPFNVKRMKGELAVEEPI